MNEGEMHATAALGTAVLVAALIVPTVWFTDSQADTGPVLDKMETIEASLAYKKPNKPSQPQKPHHEANPEVKPDGVSHDENKKPDEKKDKKDDKKDKDKDTDPLAKFRRSQDDDTTVGKPETQIGDFNGSEFGDADVTKGDPYVGRIKADIEQLFKPAEIARVSGDPPYGCIHLMADGTVKEITFKHESTDDLQPPAEMALKKFMTNRNKDPQPVPTYLQQKLTTQWLCFHFKANSAS